MTDGLRELFGLENELDLPIVKVIEFLSNNGMLNLEICTIDEMVDISVLKSHFVGHN